MQQHFCVAAVGPADEQDDVGSGLAELVDGCSVEVAVRHVDDPRAGGQPDAKPRLRSDGALIADDGEPQSATRR